MTQQQATSRTATRTSKNPTSPSPDAQIIAEKLGSVATWLKYLGNGNAATDWGAIEGLSKSVKDGEEAIASSVGGAGDAIANSITEAAATLAQSIDGLTVAIIKILQASNSR